MSVNSWKREFYPETAKQAARKGALAAAEHSLKKWQGLQAENLKKHGVANEDGEIDRDSLAPGGDSCALCKFSSREEDRWIRKHGGAAFDGFNCAFCPGYQANKVTCEGVLLGRDGRYSGQNPKRAPYCGFLDEGQKKIRPMLRWLENTVAAERKKV